MPKSPRPRLQYAIDLSIALIVGAPLAVLGLAGLVILFYYAAGLV